MRHSLTVIGQDLLDDLEQEIGVSWVRTDYKLGGTRQPIQPRIVREAFDPMRVQAEGRESLAQAEIQLASGHAGRKDDVDGARGYRDSSVPWFARDMDRLRDPTLESRPGNFSAVFAMDRAIFVMTQDKKALFNFFLRQADL